MAPSLTQQGYTLVEILVVLAILGLIAALAMPPAAHTVETILLRTDARAVAGELRDLRREASGRAAPIVVRQSSSGGLNESTGEEFALPHGSRVTLAGDSLIFYADGTTNGGTLTVTREDQALLVRVAWLTGDIAITGAP